MDIQLEIEGVSDQVVADAIRKRVRTVGRLVAGSGEWRVSLGPSETRGEWDLGIQTTAGWQLASFAELVDRLPETVDRELRERLNLPMPAVVTKEPRRSPRKA